MDHSMIRTMKSVENIINGEVQKDNFWNVNIA